MKKIVSILATLLTFSCTDYNKSEPQLKSDTLQNKHLDKKILFPIKAVKRNLQNLNEDTFVCFVDNTNFLLTPEGRLLWGRNMTDSIQLKTRVIIEKAYLYKVNNVLYIFYTETDDETATSRVEKIDLKSKKQLWRADVIGFNLGIPYLIDNFAYLTTIGTVNKLNLVDGKYKYQFIDLYDSKKYSFNSFDTIIFKDDLTIFLSTNYYSKKKDSLIVNEKTGDTILRKH